jgi:hypothetical protein
VSTGALSRQELLLVIKLLRPIKAWQRLPIFILIVSNGEYRWGEYRARFPDQILFAKDQILPRGIVLVAI